MRRIEELAHAFPFAGARMLARLSRREGHEVGRRRVRTRMKPMGVEALARGCVSLTAMVDWTSGKVRSYRISITLEAVHAAEAPEEAFARYGLPDIVNTNQRSQFTAGAGVAPVTPDTAPT